LSDGNTDPGDFTSIYEGIEKLANLAKDALKKGEQLARDRDQFREERNYERDGKDVYSEKIERLQKELEDMRRSEQILGLALRQEIVSSKGASTPIELERKVLRRIHEVTLEIEKQKRTKDAET